MKVTFLIATIVLAGAAVFAVVTLPKYTSDVPLMYWTSDPNPARGPQIAAFMQWMADNDYGNVKLELDSNNGGVMKVIIQSASGVASDIVDCYNGNQLRQYVASGVLMDVTDLAKKYGFGLEKTYAAAEQEISVDGRQYTFPCNVSAFPLTINRALLEREGLPLPKFDWTWDEFLRWCLAVRKIDENGRVTRFAVWPFRADKLWYANGGTIFNETMTRCTADSPQVREATQFYYDLMFKHHVMPTPVDQSSAPSREGYGGAMLQWLGTELTVSVAIGRYGLIQLRRFENFSPDVALFPHKVMPMQPIGARSAGINACGDNPELVARFLQFLASKEYNRIIVADADALPPNPAAARTPEFLAPKKYPDEHHAHAKYRRAAEEFGVGREYSRFVNPEVVERTIISHLEGTDTRQLTVDQALRGIAAEINRELGRTVERDRKLTAKYRDAVELQSRIDDLKAAGEEPPLEWIANPVIRRLKEAGK